MSNVTDDLIDRTIVLWQPRLRRDLSREDAWQIAANVAGFFSVLVERSHAEKLAAANDASTTVANKEAYPS